MTIMTPITQNQDIDYENNIITSNKLLRKMRFMSYIINVRMTIAVMFGRHAMSVNRLFDIPLTIVGFGCIDSASFNITTWFGLVVTGISLFIIERMIADDD
jgi:hypothetical protein